MTDYIFKTQSDGAVIGGFPMKRLLENHNDIGMSRFENLVIPSGLLIKPMHKYSGGSQHEVKEYVQEGGENIIFDKLFNTIAIVTKSFKGKTQKNKNMLNVTKRNKI